YPSPRSMALVRLLFLIVFLTVPLVVIESSPFQLEKRSVYGAFRHVPGYMIDAAGRNKKMMRFDPSDYY
ncbi:hypothetical protein PMAYCL1PPCAC_02847, partial [Pristionchus mayeri]